MVRFVLVIVQTRWQNYFDHSGYANSICRDVELFLSKTRRLTI